MREFMSSKSSRIPSKWKAEFNCKYGVKILWRWKFIWGWFFFFSGHGNLVYCMEYIKQVEIRFKVWLGEKHQLCYTGIPHPNFQVLRKTGRKKQNRLEKIIFGRHNLIIFK